MNTLPSPFRSAMGKAEYMAAYEASMQLWPVAYAHMDVSGPYGRTHVVATGPQGAPALVLLHMDYLSSTMWATNIADLSRDYRVYAVDVVGQPGKSVPDKPMRERDDAVAWITGLLDGLELEKATLVGASYGGWFALNYAICVPQRLDKLILLSPGGSFCQERPSFYLNVLPALILPFLPQRLLFDRFLRTTVLEENLRDPQTQITNERVGRQTYVGFRHFRVWKYWLAQMIAPHVFPDDELRGMRVPTLLLIGQQETLYDSAVALERARRLLPDLDGELIPRANHAMTVEQHKIVDRRILEFLQRRATIAPQQEMVPVPAVIRDIAITA
jgi:pimeloyl-ACP methyl ester carboxylesterase